MESLPPGAPGGNVAVGWPVAVVSGGVGGPAVAGPGELVPGIVFVGASDALERVTALVDTLVAELAGLSLAGAGRDVLRSLVGALGRVRAGADAAEARAVTALERLGDGGVDAVEVLRRNAGSSQPQPQPQPTVPRHQPVPPRQQPVPPRHQIVIVASADVVTGKDPQGRCEIPGIGPIPQSELERLACDAELFGVLFSGDGDPLWHGRGERTATDAQRRALLARDGVCVLCAEEPARCESHHIVPWAKPGEGPTDIDNLALLCGTCHRRLHNHKRVLTRSPDGAWGTAPDPRHAGERHSAQAPDTQPRNPEARSTASRSTPPPHGKRRTPPRNTSACRAGLLEMSINLSARLLRLRPVTMAPPEPVGQISIAGSGRGTSRLDRIARPAAMSKQSAEPLLEPAARNACGIRVGRGPPRTPRATVSTPLNGTGGIVGLQCLSRMTDSRT